MAEIPQHGNSKRECPWLWSTVIVYEMSTSTDSAYFWFPKTRESLHMNSQIVGAHKLISHSFPLTIWLNSLSVFCVFVGGGMC